MNFELTTTGAVKESIATITRFLKAYQDGHPGVLIDHSDFHWGDAWQHLSRVALHQPGVVISEIGTPWVSDFVAMNSLRPFTRPEVEAVGGANAFFSEPWSSVVIAPSSVTPGASFNISSAPGVYALPARADVRLIYYWKDMLDKAGVDPATAFTTPEQLEQTLERLHAAGTEPCFRSPWMYQAHENRNWVYNIASWIWAYGGDLTDEIGLPVFDEPKAIEGMAAYFRLHRFLAARKSGENVEQVFSQRRAAVMTMATHYHIHLLHDEDPYGFKDLLSLLGAARLPGPAFVGGTSFVIWRHTPDKSIRTAVDLLTRLYAAPQLAEYCYETHMLPSRVDGFQHPQVAADPFLPVLKAALTTGRAQPAGRLWMPIANELAADFQAISGELLEDPGKDVRAVVEQHAHALVKQLKKSFAAA